MSGPDPVVVAAYWTVFATATSTPGRPDDVYGFGESDEEADLMADLVLAGVKRATVGPLTEYDDLGRRPRVGDHVVVLRGDHAPVAVVRLTEVRTDRLSTVDEDFARADCEGDGTREDWVERYGRFVERTRAAEGRAPDPDPLLVFQRFDLVWKSAVHGAPGA